MLYWWATEVTCFLLVEFGPVAVVRGSEHEFLLERLHVLVLSEASLASYLLPTCYRVGLRPLPLMCARLASKPLSTLASSNHRSSFARLV